MENNSIAVIARLWWTTASAAIIKANIISPKSKSLKAFSSNLRRVFIGKDQQYRLKSNDQRQEARRHKASGSATCPLHIGDAGLAPSKIVPAICFGTLMHSEQFNNFRSDIATYGP